MRLPRADGLWLVQRCRDSDASLPVIMITGHGDVSLAVEAMRSGAYDFIEKPFSPEVLVEVVKRALEKRMLTLEVAALRQTLAQRDSITGKLIGRSPQIERVRRLVLEVAQSPVDVLIRGETGTGKELVAQALHEMSPRKNAPFVALNCGGMPDNLLDSELFGHEQGAFTGAQKRRIGKIEYANGGTLFLDELETMPMAMQIKLLRVLQERRIERVGSNQQIAGRRAHRRRHQGRPVAASRARARFAPTSTTGSTSSRSSCPRCASGARTSRCCWSTSCCSRRAGSARPQPTVSYEQMHRLMAHSWPGNVRELRNIAECVVLGVHQPIMGEPAGSAPEAITSLVDTVESFERGSDRRRAEPARR